MRSRITALSKSKPILVGLTATVALALGGTGVGYASLTKDVTLTLDGEAVQVTALGGTVGDLLEAEGVELTGKDLVAPALDEPIVDGTSIAVQFGRPLELQVDGEARTYWVNSTDVSGALGEIGRRFSDASLSTSRSAAIGRDGMSLEIVTPKKLRVTVGRFKAKRTEVTALTVADVLDKMDIGLGKRDKVRPALDAIVEEGDKVVVTRVRVKEKKVRGERIGHKRITRKDDSMFEGETEVIRPGADGVRNVTYRLRFKNGELVRRKVVEQTVRRKAVPAIVKVGTKEQPSENFASGSTVWDALANCESGGNWAINTGNGYYGGLQFSAATWASVGGTGLPHQHSRAEQIKRGQILQSRAGWGQWPHCTSKLGLR